MKTRRVLFVIDGDPRRSGRPAEAIRIAAGVSAWRAVELRLFLSGPAVLVLNEACEDFVDDEHYVRYMPMLTEAACSVHVEARAPELAQVKSPVLGFRELDLPGLARLAVECDSVIRF